MPMSDLGLASIEDLMTELCSRADAVVIIGWQKTNVKDKSIKFDQFAGGIVPCLGLCHMMIGRLNELDRQSKPVDGLGT